MKKQLLIIAVVLVGAFTLISMNILTTNPQEPWKVPAKYEKMVNPLADAADAEMVGRKLYAKHCKSCHGTKGKGDGAKADTVDTEIGDFTEDAFKSQSDGALYYKTYIGRDDMPSFSKKIPGTDDQWKVINYIKGL